MNPSALRRLSESAGTTEGMNPLRHIHARVVPLVLVGVVALGTGAGLAFARGNKSAPIGTGVVVIDTNLAYQNGTAAATGMVLSSSGEVLTNNHVIKGATTITVVIPRTGRSYAATVVGYDVSDDVAVLQLAGASNLKTVNVSTAKLTVGRAVTAVGNAGGTGTLSSAKGTITGLGKSITARDDQGGVEQLTGLIETNAALQPGDSGGPLVDSSGRVVGMDTAASTGFGFQAATRTSDAYAIPIRKATTIAKTIVSGTGSATVHVGSTAFLGIQVGSLDQSAGALIVGVVPDGPAASAGLTAGDIITSVDGNSISSPSDVSSLILTEKPGTTVTVGYTDQSGTSQTASVTLGSGPAQ
jgi:S1-C subfamily serine protease